MVRNEVLLRVEWENEKALKAFSCAGQMLCELAEGEEWREDVQKAIRALKYAMKHIKVTTSEDV